MESYLSYLMQLGPDLQLAVHIAFHILHGYMFHNVQLIGHSISPLAGLGRLTKTEVLSRKISLTGFNFRALKMCLSSKYNFYGLDMEKRLRRIQ